MLFNLYRTVFSRPLLNPITRSIKGITIPNRSCNAVTVFGINKLLEQEKQTEFEIHKVTRYHHEIVLDMIKQLYLKEHILVRARNMDLDDDRALDEYLMQIINQGNTLYATADGVIAGVCVGYASSSVDPRNLRNYAFYRQDPNTKDFLYFMAKLQETPNLWQTFKQNKIFEVKMLAVAPEFRRMGLATKMVEKCKEEAHDQGFNVIRMNCIRVIPCNGCYRSYSFT